MNRSTLDISIEILGTISQLYGDMFCLDASISLIMFDISYTTIESVCLLTRPPGPSAKTLSNI